MIVTQLRYETDLEFPRISARIEWEQTDRPPFHLFFETSPRHASVMSLDPNAFLVACFMPAWRAREQRVLIDEPICPVLARNLRAASAIVQTWYPEAPTPPAIQSEGGFVVHRPEGASAAAMMSCGVDSLATFRWNKLNIPPNHPDAIDGVIVFIPKKSLTTDKKAVEGTIGRWSASSNVASEAGAEAIAVLSNVWWVASSGYFFDYVWHGALLCATAYLFSGRFRKVLLASCSSAGKLEPWGTHPMLDPFFSSAHFQVAHDGLEMTRFEKVALLADWPVGLQNLRVCQNNSTGDRNCGKCEKCIRTQIALLALGKLREAAFPNDELGPQVLNRLLDFDMLAHPYDWGWYPPLIQPLKDCGRHDVAARLSDILAAFRAREPVAANPIEIW